MTKPRQLAPTVGLSHDGFKFLEGNFEGLKGYAVGRMTKSHRGKLYIDDAGWGSEAGSIDRKSTRLNSSHLSQSRMPSSA